MSDARRANDQDATIEEILAFDPGRALWIDLVAVLKRSAALERQRLASPSEENDKLPSQRLMQDLLTLLARQELFRLRPDYLFCLSKLADALWELNEGRTRPMLRATEHAKKPGQSSLHATIKGLAARAMSELMEAGISREKAARRVSAALSEANKQGLAEGTRSPSVTWKTVAGWRDKVKEGPSESEAPTFRLAYQMNLNDDGSTPLERGEQLLEQIRLGAHHFV